MTSCVFLILFPNFAFFYSMHRCWPYPVTQAWGDRNGTSSDSQQWCEPILGHNLLFWYRQTFMQGLELLSYFWSQSIIDDAGMPMDGFSAERPDGPFSTWKIQPTEQGDSAVCVCASRLAIALQTLPLPVQKFWCFLFSPQLPAILSSLSCLTLPTRIIMWFGAWQRQKTIQYQHTKSCVGDNIENAFCKFLTNCVWSQNSHTGRINLNTHTVGFPAFLYLPPPSKQWELLRMAMSRELLCPLHSLLTLSHEQKFPLQVLFIINESSFLWLWTSLYNANFNLTFIYGFLHYT